MNYHVTLHPVSWFNDRYRDGSLEIRPPYQRNPVWGLRQKCYLIESILLKLPIPEVYVQQVTSDDGSTRFALVDGQQRVRSILQFIGSEMDPDEQGYNRFSLEKLKDDSNWKDKTLADLSAQERMDFFSYTFAVRYLNTNNNNEIKDMFRRLNKYLTPLKPQELRNATFGGPFAQLVNQLADEPYWAEARIVTPAQIRRQNDVEFVAELLIGVIHGPQGGSAQIIDDYYTTYEDLESLPNQRKTLKLFSDVLELIKILFPNIGEYRWVNKTDFYSLFVGLAYLLSSQSLPKSKHIALRGALIEFAALVDSRVANGKADTSDSVGSYTMAVQRGVNDKSRRGDRHLALLSIMEPYFK